ncbi:hypothetical protein [Stakelama pacifica]|uniref:Uncharacterized protein n=1 Tax=Stakelama pacifica TaxID=517720 RepID=A0A4R6FBP2_9SPHN|nr:hypothetical protein [Stakelama pacifica]MAW99109.1 hypothetical protein [Sphingomonas sp.]TDN78589.1 hypothetical protein EV664_11632 [Stakelama pacifica]GGO99347.1 hypothetical protein GCM10011329_32630 [Stakelama pacifica]
MLDTFAVQYHQVINDIVALCPAPDKFAHTYAGLIIWLLSGIFMRRPLWSFLTLVPPVVLEVANEYMDRIVSGSWNWPDTRGDAAATWFWPLILVLAMRYMPWLRGGSRSRR